MRRLSFASGVLCYYKMWDTSHVALQRFARSGGPPGSVDYSLHHPTAVPGRDHKRWLGLYF